MNQYESEPTMSARSRVRALGKLAAVAPLAALGEIASCQSSEGPKTSANAKPANKTLTTGEYFAAILLAVTPSALGIALGTAASKPNATIQDWINALPDAGDTPQVNAALTKMLNDPRYAPIFTALLAAKTIAAPDGTVFKDAAGKPVPITAAPLVKDIVWNEGSQGTNLALPWSRPPHPTGNDLLALVNHLNAFQEKQGA
jgi:hypothetical protein